MILMGDEYAHSKNGNNNTWCHDSRLNWFQWDTLEKKRDFFRFYSKLIAFRKAHPILYRSRFLRENDITWHGKEPQRPDWSEKSRFLAFSLSDPINDYELYIAFNASTQHSNIQLPSKKNNHIWYRIVDTSQESPEDFIEDERAQPITQLKQTMPAFSAILLKSHLTQQSH